MNTPVLEPGSKPGLAQRAGLPALALAVAILIGVLLLGGFGRMAPDPARQRGRRILFYQDSMHPWIKSERAGKCTICGMDLSAVYEGEKANEVAEGCVRLSPTAITVLNIQTEEVKRQSLAHTLQVAGTLEVNETRKRIIAAPAAGRIDELMVDYAGVEVSENQPLVTFYSPALAQNTLKFLVRSRHTGEQRDPAGNMARELDSNPYYADLLAPQTGTVLERKVTKGQYVAEGEKLFTIADASVLWFRFDVYEKQLPWVHRGQKIQVTVSSVPGKTYAGVISFIEPMLNEATRSVKVRADIPNPVVETEGQRERLLRFGMFADGVLEAEAPQVVRVPRTAVIYPGNSAYAYVDKGSGVYERRQVRLGREGGGSWEVLEGLKEGERVVVSGGVLLDSQAQFDQPTLDRMEDQAGMFTGTDTHDSAATPLVSSKAMPTPGLTEAVREPAVSTEMPDKNGMSQAGMNGFHPVIHAEVPSSVGGASMPMLRSGHASHALAGPVKTNAAPMSARVVPKALASAQAKARALTTQEADYVPPSVHMIDDQIMNRFRERRIAESLENPPSITEAKFSEAQCQSLQAFWTAASNIAQALAADDLAQFNGHVSTLSNLVARLNDQFVLGDRWKGHILHFNSAYEWPPAKDLVEARAQFLPFTINVVALATELRKQLPTFAGLKIYHCPMAPKPGLWLQTQGPLANPFFGPPMLRCGQEVEANRELASRQGSAPR